jgi:predicted dehydrogenase
VGLGLGCKTTAISQSRVRGANEAVRVAVIGMGGRGGGLCRGFLRTPNVQVAALCDPDQNHLDEHLAKVEEEGGKAVGYRDLRHVLDDPEIDAVVIATPNHWHAAATVWVCQAGKDVYVEKPVSHNVWEGRKIVEAAKKYGRIVQCGMQRRSDEGWAEAIEWLRAGNLGKILCSRGLCYKRRPSIGKVEGAQPIPPRVDYDLWCGPREKAPLTRKDLHYDWHWVWPTGNGDLGNQGVHQVDVAAWAIGATDLPESVLSIGGRFGYVDDGETPNTEIIFYDYKPAPLIFEVRGLAMGSRIDESPVYRNTRIGNIVECEGGWLSEAWVYDNDGKRMKQFGIRNGGDHIGNFIEAVRSRRVEDLNAPPETGHLSSALCHVGSISQRVGREAAPEAIEAALAGDAMAMETFERMREHLVGNGIDLSDERAVLGPRLKIDARRERFAGNGALDEAANALIKDGYREPYTIAERV